MDQNQILITSSDNIPYSEIEEQLGIVDSQIVVGANIFRDVFAGFRDLFGGETKGYKKDIDKMNAAALSSIKDQAKEKKANAIISLRMDLDEVSGKGKSMFMVNIYGSAVRLKKTALKQKNGIDNINEISKADVGYFKSRNQIIQKMRDSENVAQEINLDFITKYNLWDEQIASEILNYSPDPGYNLKSKIKNNLKEMPIASIEKFLFNNIHKLDMNYWYAFYESLEQRDWANYNFLNELLTESNYIKRFRGLKLSKISREFYQKKDISELKNVGKFLSSNFDNSMTTKKIDKMIGSKEIYICPNCLGDKKMTENCGFCHSNNYGLKDNPKTPEQIGKNLIATANAIESAMESVNP